MWNICVVQWVEAWLVLRCSIVLEQETMNPHQPSSAGDVSRHLKNISFTLGQICKNKYIFEYTDPPELTPTPGCYNAFPGAMCVWRGKVEHWVQEDHLAVRLHAGGGGTRLDGFLSATAIKTQVRREAARVRGNRDGDWNGRGVLASYLHVRVCLCWCCEGLNESQCAHMGHHKQTLKNESGEAVQPFSLREQRQAGVRTFGDNRFVCVQVCVQVCVCVGVCVSVRAKQKLGKKRNKCRF